MSQYEVMDMEISQENRNETVTQNASEVLVIQQPDISQTNQLPIVDNVIEVETEVSTSNTNASATTLESVAMVQTSTVSHTDAPLTQVYSIIPSGRNTGTKSSLIQSGVNVVYLSPKPATTAVQNSQEQFKEKTKHKMVEEAKEEEESENCPICFEQWSNSGAHRLSSLNCGHLFGRSCVERWLRTKGRDKCPQCNAPAKRHQIRNIYAKVIKALDTSEIDATLRELAVERKARIEAEKAKKAAEEAEANARIQCQMVRAECERVKTKAEKARRHAEESAITVQMQYNLCQAECGRIKKDLERRKVFFEQVHQSTQNLNRRFVFERSQNVAQNGARVMAFDSYSCTLVVSKPSPNNNIPGYGVIKVSCMNFKPSQYIPLHSKPIRDAVFSNQNDSLLLTAGVDKRLNITSMNTNSQVLSYSLPAAVWSCVWDTSDINYVFAGLQNGQCHIFDIRNTNTPLDVLTCDERCPLVSLAFVPVNVTSKMKACGLLTCSLEHGLFWEKNVTRPGYVLNSNLQVPAGSCTCLRFDPNTRHCILSQRPSKECNKSRHTTFELSGVGLYTDDHGEPVDMGDGPAEVRCEPVVQFFAGTSQNRLCHSTAFTCPDNNYRLYGCVGDEASNTVLLWDAFTGKKIQEIPSQGTAMDVCAFQANDADFLATLTEKNLSFYKWANP